VANKPMLPTSQSLAGRSQRCERKMKDNFVANGRETLLGTPEVQEKLAEIRLGVEAQYAYELANAGWLRRHMVKAKMERQIDREISHLLDQIAPRDALYLHQR